MKTFENKIITAQQIYKSQNLDSALKAWPIKMTKCKILLYKDEPCSDIDIIICSTLYSHDCILSANDLATILGFNVIDNLISTPKRYKDIAEIEIFNNLLIPLEKDELIIHDGDTIELTSLGKFSVENAKKRSYFVAECKFMENLNLHSNGTTVFPFRDALSITTEIRNRKRVSFYKDLPDYNIQPQPKEEETSLIEAILAQISEAENVFSASLDANQFEIESEKLDIAIYNEDNVDYVIVFSKNGEASEFASTLFNDRANSKIKAIKVEWGYYLRLLNDSNAALNFNNLKPFEDIIEWDKVIKDDRFCWDDYDLFKMLYRNIDANVWSDVSSICPTQNIEAYLKEFPENWDWSILSARINGVYINRYADKYPWDFDIVIHNPNVSGKDIEQLLINQNLTSVQWLWNEIMSSLSDDFVFSHIEDVAFDLSTITEKNPNLVKKILPNHPDKIWDWAYISQSYDLAYILSHIELFSKRLNLEVVTLRALGSNEFAHSYCICTTFKEELKSMIEASLSPLNFNSSDIIWNEETINFLEDVGAISWCVPIIGGFETNPYIKWDKNFFNNYSEKISSTSGYSCVTSRVDDITIVDEHPEFPWDWNIISSKADWIANTAFVGKYIACLNLSIAFDLLSSDTFCSVFEYPEMQSFLSSHLDKKKVTNLATIQLVRNHIEFDWDWDILTSKTINTIKVEKLGDKRWVEKWNWIYLSESLSTDNISDYLSEYQDNWDWDILTKRLDRTTILENLAEFTDKWNWPLLVKSIFTKEDLCINGNLSAIATLISLKNNELRTLLWEQITKRFSLEELYDQIHSTVILTDYSQLFQWDLSYVYNHPDFNFNEYINKYPDDINWNLLSKSKSAERLFSFDKEILSFEMWLKMVKSLLYNKTYHWDYYSLSHNDAINWNATILSIHKSQWDWQYLSQYSRCFSNSKDRKVLYKGIKQFKDVLDFQVLSERLDIIFDDELLSKFLTENWNWESISASDRLSVSSKFLNENKDKNWDWVALSQGQCLTIDKELLDGTKDKAWDWNLLSSNRNLTLTLAELLELGITEWNWDTLSGRTDILFDNDSIISTLDKSHITWNWLLLSTRSDLQYNEELIFRLLQKPMDWKCISRMSTFVPSTNVLSKLSSLDLDWDAISKNKYLSKEVLWPYRDRLNWSYISESAVFQKLGKDFFEKYKMYLDWSIISCSENFNLSIENLKEFKGYVNWTIINQRKDLKYTNELIDEFADYINWSDASKANTINFSVDFIKKYVDRWDWYALLKNPLIVENIDIYKSAFRKKANIIKFIERFHDPEPKVYHFAHLFNALNIIKSRKILSRIGGKGLFENSAGSNVNRRDTAHHYARFYYRPQTPTQYYNEALGEDSHSSKERFIFQGYDSRGKKKWSTYMECPTTKYRGAQRLGFPKCPMPVFFEFDLREILNKFSDMCYYSTGNMQKDSSQVVSIGENPNRLNTDYIYSTIEDGIDTYKDYSQQEFLVWKELDFSCLDSLRIICYNEEQAELLKMLLGADPIRKHITTDSETSSGINVYHRKNRTISIKETDDEISFSTDYQDPSTILIECNDINKIDFIDKSTIKNISDGKVQAYPTISFKKTALPITVRFVDLQKYDSNSWVIYTNEPNAKEMKSTYSNITMDLVEQFRSEVSNLQIQISKSLFKNHMLHSYHGIAHTVRVMWNAFLIASLDGSVDKNELPSILYASLIHDLGKRSDIEGEIHGENSAILYKTKIEHVCSHEDAVSILEAVKYHSIDDSKTPLTVRQNKIWEILKDADALDRSRLPGRGCNPAFLRNDIFTSKEGKELLSLAKELPSLTTECSWEHPCDEFINIIKSII
jgi:hypothetical protein